MNCNIFDYGLYPTVSPVFKQRLILPRPSDTPHFAPVLIINEKIALTLLGIYYTPAGNFIQLHS